MNALERSEWGRIVRNKMRGLTRELTLRTIRPCTLKMPTDAPFDSLRRITHNLIRTVAERRYFWPKWQENPSRKETNHVHRKREGISRKDQG